MLLGHKTRIDKTIAGLLQHQMTITQKIAFTIGLQHSSSRIPKTVPKFLRSVATRLSADTFATVKKEWERFVNLMAGATTKRVPGMGMSNLCATLENGLVPAYSSRVIIYRVATLCNWQNVD
ncbi:hypothetical protein L916_10405 [Phytophthora nicotianae]|uniref:Uncharacterized protein n=1 Tax=Phytophthora nicotianae TaxID=4792 RepID=W2IUX3_PHYNI|nr:hypothetical protein L916_10405 [Phytophthora nicotianae]